MVHDSDLLETQVIRFTCLPVFLCPYSLPGPSFISRPPKLQYEFSVVLWLVRKLCSMHVIIIIMIIAENGSFLRGWLPHREERLR